MPKSDNEGRGGSDTTEDVATGFIEPIEIQEEMERSFLEYSMSVIVSRALPDVRDGLKPVHRRILYSMYDQRLLPDRPHSKCAKVVGDGRLLHGDLQQGSLAGVHGGVAQLRVVHFAQPLQALEFLAVVRVLEEEGRPGRVVLEIRLLLAHLGRVERGLGHVDESALDERLHLAEEEGEQQGPDVRAVHIGVGQDDDLVVADLGDVEILGQACADGRYERLDLGVLQHLVDAGPLDVEDLAPDGQDGLGLRVAGILCGAPRGVPLDDEELARPGVPG